MSQNIQLRRSAVPGKVPTTLQLDLGEIAINTNDGKLFFKKDDGTESIVTVLEVTEDNLAVDSSSLTNSSATYLSGLLSDFDSAISLAGGGGGGGITYTVKTANYTASAGEGILADTSSTSFTVTLPSSPSAGDQVIVADAGSGWGTNNLTIGRNGSTIEGTAEDLICNIDGISVQLVYDGSTWEVFGQVGATSGTGGGGGGITYALKTANYTASAGEGILADTSGGSFTVTLPSSPSTGDQVIVADSGGDWGTNNLTIARNGSSIEDTSDDLICDIAGSSVQLVYSGTTWEVYTQVGVGNDAGSAGPYIVKTANYTALAGQSILANTTGGAFTITLPATPSTGDQVVIADSGSAWNINNLTVGRNGSTIESSAADLVLDIEDALVQFIYDGSTWQVFTQIGAGGLAHSENFNTASSSSGTATLDLSTGNVFSVTLTENISTFTWSNAPASGTAYGFTLKIVQDSTARTITWPAGVDWVAATAPTLSSGSGDVDIFAFFTHDGGTTWYGFTAGQDLS